jgi:RNA polymerase sigma-70 factor (ECF subfamily)
MDRQTDRFLTTHWSLILSASNASTPEASEALAALCEAYWYPVYAYIRKRGYDVDEARDLTQSFFTRLLEKNDLRAVDPARGRFRSFLLTAVRHFLSNQHDRQSARKRGGGQPVLTLEIAVGEERFIAEPSDQLDPEKIFERRWAMEVLERALRRLSTEYSRVGESRIFDALKSCLTDTGPDISYRSIAADLDMSEGAVGVAVHRLRRRFGVALRQEVAQTVADADVDHEIRHLLRTLGG